MSLQLAGADDDALPEMGDALGASAFSHWALEEDELEELRGGKDLSRGCHSGLALR